jgi:hypothetical protein
MSQDVGTLQRLSARDVFDHEAYDFTTWMENNVDALSGVLEIDLTTSEREKNVGDFSAHLFAEDEAGRRVIIENQLEETDHQHLGQLLTYLTFLDADLAIWVTADARPEHVSAVYWLNENATGADFYLVKVEGVQVDDSRPAPLFTRIVGPSQQTRAARQAKQEWNQSRNGTSKTACDTSSLSSFSTGSADTRTCSVAFPRSLEERSQQAGGVATALASA